MRARARNERRNKRVVAHSDTSGVSLARLAVVTTLPKGLPLLTGHAPDVAFGPGQRFVVRGPPLERLGSAAPAQCSRMSVDQGSPRRGVSRVGLVDPDSAITGQNIDRLIHSRLLSALESGS